MYNIFNIYKKVIKKIEWVFEDFLWFWLRPIYRFFHFQNSEISFTIGITTFMDRYNNCLKPLVRKILLLFPNCQIIVIANGHVKQEEQKRYLKKITKFIASYINVRLISHLDPKGLSNLWNQVIDNAKYDKILMLNDDVKIKRQFYKFLVQSGIIHQPIATINISWSHFVISKNIFTKVGLFDEGLKEIGGEDDDYSARLAMESITINNYFTKTIAGKLGRKKKIPVVNSYGKNMKSERLGYSDYNSAYLEKKWEMHDTYFSGAFNVPNHKVRYWKLKK